MVGTLDQHRPAWCPADAKELHPSASSPGYGYGSPAYVVTEPAPALLPGLVAASPARASWGCWRVMDLWGGRMGFGGFLGFLLQLLLVLLVRFLVRLFRGPSPIFAVAGPGMFARAGPASLGQTGAGRDAAWGRKSPSAPPIAYRAFEQLLQDIQAGPGAPMTSTRSARWSRRGSSFELPLHRAARWADQPRRPQRGDGCALASG